MTIPNLSESYLGHLSTASATALIWSLVLFPPAVWGNEEANKLFWLVAGIAITTWVMHATAALALTMGDR